MLHLSHKMVLVPKGQYFRVSECDEAGLVAGLVVELGKWLETTSRCESILWLRNDKQIQTEPPTKQQCEI